MPGFAAALAQITFKFPVPFHRYELVNAQDEADSVKQRWFIDRPIFSGAPRVETIQESTNYHDIFSQSSNDGLNISPIRG